MGCSRTYLQKNRCNTYYKTGGVKISTKDFIEADKIDFTLKSAGTNFEGIDQMKYLCDLYNKEIPINTLQDFAENKAFIKALKFTGKYSIVNEILNQKQLQKLREIWLTRNVIYREPEKYSKQTVSFILNNDWAQNFIDKNIKESCIQ